MPLLLAIEIGVVNGNHLPIFRNQRATRIAGVNCGIVFNHPINRSPTGLAVGLLFRDNAAGQGKFRITQRITGGINRQAGKDFAFIPF